MSDVLARREAVASICQDAATSVLDRVVGEAGAATHPIGLSSDSAARYGEAIKATLPAAFEAMRMPDGPERDARIAELAGLVRGVTDDHHIPRIVERGLVAIAYRVTREVIRRRASQTTFTADELEAEFVDFGERLGRDLFEL